jgi:hypothetical protein
MSFSDNHMFIPNPLTTAANSIAEEGTTSGAGKVEYVAPADLDIEEFGLLVAVTLGNTITTSTGFILAKVDAAGTETVLERIVPCNNANTTSGTGNNWYAGDGSTGGGTVAAATTFAFPAGTILSKKVGAGSGVIKQGEIIRMWGSTTVGSATGDVVPFVVCRVAGRGYKGTNVYNEGVLTRARNAAY